MKLTWSVILFFVCWQVSVAQNPFKVVFPHTALTLQYAGSTGFLSFGYSRLTVKQKIELGIYGGWVPAYFGRPEQLVTLKFAYIPFHLKLQKRIVFQPISSGVFFCQHFGEYHGLTWENKYPYKYYWWNRSLRSHVFVGSQLTLLSTIPRIQRFTFYAEFNTNDLYLYSYLPNRKSIEIHQIFFVGIGLKTVLN